MIGLVIYINDEIKGFTVGEFINVGDDMGFENLKKAKMPYRPYRLVPKYTIYKR